MALGAGDAPMAWMIGHHFLKHNRIDEALKQFTEQLPNDFRQEQSQRAKHIAALNKVVAVIATSNTNDECEAYIM